MEEVDDDADAETDDDDEEDLLCFRRRRGDCDGASVTRRLRKTILLNMVTRNVMIDPSCLTSSKQRSTFENHVSKIVCQDG